MRAALIAAVMASMATPTWAELPPYVYERARAEADTVMIIAVHEVAGLADGQARGTCVVRGVIEEVQRGDRHALGDEVAVDTPCIGPTYQSMPGPFPGYDAQALKAMQRALVFLKDGELVARGLEDQSSPVATQ
ncbi:MAG: hypothetical protein EON91_08995 [Brevundimonas sp.]|uniref:hypothetical protein n=1 Tax=Brevundimonas sp. TaxID=1871086 RepID=UPI001201F8F9|nr:hypothetical protein [Brevundimonas sp.]RZJ17550.1 MAG: hypothetical protein EON91_08995 [Brevundimonas sp.]